MNEVGGSLTQKKLPTSYQYYLTLILVNSPKFMALYHAVRYMFTSRSRRRSLAPVLLLAFSGAFLVVTFGWAIKGLDLVLHDRIVPTTMRNVTQLTDYASDVRITAGCDDAKSLRCSVDTRAIEARSGGLNQSSDFRVYSHQDPDIGMLSFIAPFGIPVNYTIGNAHTYAAHTAPPSWLVRGYDRPPAWKRHGQGVQRSFSPLY
jgi:hypothetical protein